MKYYAIGLLNIHDPAWIAEYLEAVTPLVEKHGGKYLARTGSLELKEGEPPAPDTVVMIEFPSKASAEALYNSEEYAPHLEARMKGSTGPFILVAGEDIAAG